MVFSTSNYEEKYEAVKSTVAYLDVSILIEKESVNIISEQKQKVRVTLKSKHDQSRLLRLSRKLQDSSAPTKNIYINKDLTPLESKHAYLLRKERDSLNSNLDESQRSVNPYVVHAGVLKRRAEIPHNVNSSNPKQKTA